MSEAPIVSQRRRMARPSRPAKRRMNWPGSAASMPFMCEGSTATPITGAKRTVTNHEAMSATAITANSVGVLAGIVVGEADRKEAKPSYKRAGQHREGRGR